MKVLLVEDDDTQAERLKSAVSVGLQPGHPVEFHHVRSRTSAEKYLAEVDSVDLVVSDLHIPAYEDGIDRSADHGFAVAAATRLEFPGTPLIFLTGFAAQNTQNIGIVLAEARVEDVFHDGEPLKMAELFMKDRLLECAQRIVSLSARLGAVDATEVEVSGGTELSPAARRAVGFAVRRWNGSRARSHIIGSGLSGGTVLRCEILDDAGRTRASLLLKIHSLQRCEDEARRYGDLIDGRLSHVAFPPLSGHLRELLGHEACLVYKFADGWDQSLFGLLRTNPSAAAVESIRDLLRPWEETGDAEATPFDTLKYRRIERDVVRAVLENQGLTVAEIDQVLSFGDGKTVGRMIQHGDLHGENVLCKRDGAVTLIDCGDVGLHPLGLDPVALELSVVFHPSSPFRPGDWPSRDEAVGWGDLDRYTANCPVSDFIRSCRAWALDVVDETDLSLTAYLHLLRQLKYGTVDPALTSAFLLGLTRP